MQSANAHKKSTCHKGLITSLVPFAFAFALLGASANTVNADVEVETHEFRFIESYPTWDTNYSIQFDIPQFDTMGGARQLLGVTIGYYYPDTTYTISVHDNPTQNVVACELRWETSFAAHGDFGIDWLPLPPDPSFLTLGRGSGAWKAAFMPAEDPFTEYREWDFTNWQQVTSDPAFLDRVTGMGSIPMDAELILSDLTVQMLSGEMVPPEAVFDPNLMSADIHELSAGLQFNYHYTPEPTTLGILVVGATALLRRRK